jgi:hypothetical protein
MATEGGLDMFSGSVSSGMQDPWGRMSCLLGKCDLTIEGIEGDTELDEVRDTVRSLFHQGANRLGIT